MQQRRHTPTEDWLDDSFDEEGETIWRHKLSSYCTNSTECPLVSQSVCLSVSVSLLFLSLILSSLCPWPVCESVGRSVCLFLFLSCLCLLFSPVSVPGLFVSQSVCLFLFLSCLLFSPVSVSCLCVSQSVCLSVCLFLFLSCLYLFSLLSLSLACLWVSQSVCLFLFLSCLYHSLLSVCPGLFVSLFVVSVSYSLLSLSLVCLWVSESVCLSVSVSLLSLSLILSSLCPWPVCQSVSLSVCLSLFLSCLSLTLNYECSRTCSLNMILFVSVSLSCWSDRTLKANN